MTRPHRLAALIALAAACLSAASPAAEKAFALNVETDTAPTIVAERSDLGTVSAGQLVRIKLQATGGNGRLRWDFARLRRNEKTAHGLRMLADVPLHRRRS